MADTRIRRTDSRREMERLVDDYITQGYEVRERGERTTLLRKKTWGSAGGHVLWALLTAWWTMGVGNLGYAFYARSQADRIMVKTEEQEQNQN